MDRLHLLKVFVAVVDASSFAAAARKMHISPPAVTRAISELESHLGVRLLTRTTRLVRVTEAGARYAEDCRQILAQLDEADESVTGTQRTPKGGLTITAPVLFGAQFVAPIVTDYLRSNPEVVARCWFLDRVVNMLDEGVDVGVRIGELTDPSMQAASVGRVRRVVCAAPAYLERHGVPRTPADLQSHVIVSASAVTPAPEWRFAANGEPCTVSVKPRMTTTSNDSALAAALAGFGITRLLSYQVDHLTSQRCLMPLLTEFELPPLPVHVVHRGGRYVSKKARTFIDLVVERLRADPRLQQWAMPL